MYKHNASSIKESSDKMFVSQSEKDKWNSKAEGVHHHPNDYFSKAEIMNRLDETNVTYYGNSARIYYSNEGHLKDLNILGNTIHPKEFKRVFPNRTYGKISFTSGLDMDNDDELHKRTDFIEVNYGDTIYFKQVNVSTPLPANVLLYDENKEFISIYNSDTPAVSIVDINLAKIKYIRYFADSTRMDKIVLYFERENVNSLISVGTEFKEHDLYEIPITVCGKNLLDLPSVYTRKLEYTYENRMPYSYRIAYCKLEHDVSYVISCEYLKEIIKPEGFEQGQSNHGGIHIGLFEHLPEEKDWWYLRQPNLKIAGDELANQTISKVFNSRKYNYLAVYIGMATGDQYDQNVTITNLQLQRGDTKTAYEEYKSTKTSIKIPYELEGLDWINDVLFVREDGMLCLNKKIGTYRFTGNEVIRDYSYDSYNLEKCVRMQINHSEYKIPNIMKDTGKVVMSNMFKGALNYKDDIPCIFNGSVGFVTNIPKSELNLDNLSTVDAFKVWVKQNEYYIKYVYETPEVIELGPADDFLGIKSIRGEMNVFVDVNVPNKIKVTVPTTVKSSIDTINRSITAINETVDNVAKNIAIGEEITVSGTASTYASNTVPGFTSNMCIGGRTIVNRAGDINKWNIDTSAGGTITTQYGNYGLTMKPENAIVKAYTAINLAPNTCYKLVVRDRLFSEGAVFSINLYHSNDINSSEVECLYTSRETGTKTNVIAFKTSASYTYTLSAECTGTGEFHLTNLMVIDDEIKDLQATSKYDGFLISSDPNIKLISHTEDNLCNGNLLPGRSIGDSHNEITKVMDCICTKDFTLIPDNTKTLYLGFNLPNATSFHSVNVYFYDENMSAMGHNFIIAGGYVDKVRGGYSFDSKTTVKPGARYVRFRIYQVADPSEETLVTRDVYINTYGNEYKPYKSITKDINTGEPLRSLPNGVRDTIEIINGKCCIVRRVGIKALKGTETYHLLTSDESNCRFWIETIESAKAHGSIYCSKLPYGPTSAEKHATFIALDQRGNTVLGINKQLLAGNEDILADAKEWICNNNLTFVYELKTPDIQPIETLGLSNIEMQLFDNCTYIKIENKGLLQQSLSYNISQNLNQSLHSITNKVIVLEGKDVSVVKSNLNSVYMSDLTSHSLALYYDEEEFGTVIDFELYDMMYTVVSSGKENYDRAIIENQIDFYTLIDRIDFDMADTLFTMIEEQHSICEIEQEIEC